MVFEVRGVPAPQPRPRAVNAGRHARVYDPGTARVWRSRVAHLARVILASETARKPYEGPIRLAVEFRLPRPRAAKGRAFPAVRPDLDNYLKALMDALTDAGVWKDDGQVVSVLATKTYAQERNLAGAKVSVEVIA